MTCLNSRSVASAKSLISTLADIESPINKTFWWVLERDGNFVANPGLSDPWGLHWEISLLPIVIGNGTLEQDFSSILTLTYQQKNNTSWQSVY